MSLLSFLGTLGLDLGQNFLNYQLFDEAQQRQERLGREGMDIVGQNQGRLSDPGSYLAGALPFLKLSGYGYGDSQGGQVDLDALFGDTPDYASSFRDAYGGIAPDFTGATGEVRDIFGQRSDLNKIIGDVNGMFSGGPDFGGAQDKLSAILGQYQRSSDSAAQEVGKYFPTDMSFRDALSSNVGAIGASSRSRAQLDRGNMISGALAQGKSLADVQGDLDRYDFESGSARALEAQQARSSSEQLRTGAAMQRAATMAQTANTQAGINSALAQAEASGVTSLTGMENEANVARGRTQADLYGKGMDMDLSRDQSFSDFLSKMMGLQSDAAMDYATGINRGQEAASQERISRSNNMLDQLYKMVFAPTMASNSAAMGSLGNIDAMMGQILAGLPVGTYQTNFGNSQSFLASDNASRQSKPERPSPFSFGISI